MANMIQLGVVNVGTYVRMKTTVHQGKAVRIDYALDKIKWECDDLTHLPHWSHYTELEYWDKSNLLWLDIPGIHNPAPTGTTQPLELARFTVGDIVGSKIYSCQGKVTRLEWGLHDFPNGVVYFYCMRCGVTHQWPPTWLQKQKASGLSGVATGSVPKKTKAKQDDDRAKELAFFFGNSYASSGLKAWEDGEDE